MSAQKKRNFQIEAFKHRVVVDPKYAEKTWKILEHAIQEMYNHKIGCVLSLSLSLLGLTASIALFQPLALLDFE
ncbi:hypothetical protein CsSME_00031087 [Camellia sinensis var. sinensis]